METNSDHRGPGDRRAMAQIRIRALLACYLQSPPDSRQKKDFEETYGSQLSDDQGESSLGRAVSHP